jgi:SAM-dependent methyltransferase
MDCTRVAGGAAVIAGEDSMSDRSHVDARRTDADRPFDAATARTIAEAFLPKFPLGNRYDYYYTRSKLRTDPLYPAVIAALEGTRAPLLDLGCGLGLLAHAMRAAGRVLPYRGVDRDADKIVRAQRIADARGLRDARFETADLADGVPAHHGSVAVLDMLQYLDATAQRELLRGVASMLDDDGVLVIRNTMADGTDRARTSRIADRLSHLIGWMQFRPRSYPTLDGLRGTLEEAGLHAESRPLYGNTPFNNWLIVARRQA